MNEFIDNNFWWLIIVGWCLFTFIGIRFFYWVFVKKKWIEINGTLWGIMLITIFLPFIIYTLFLIVLAHYLPRKYAIKLKIISESGK